MTIALALLLAAAAPQVPAPSPNEIVAAAPAKDWVAIDPQDLLVMTLAPDTKGRARRVVIQLIPPPFSQGWVANIRTLAKAHWYDGVSINRVQDNYVVQWGDANADDNAKAKLVSAGVEQTVRQDYTAPVASNFMPLPGGRDGSAVDGLIAQMSGQAARRSQAARDAYAPVTGFFQGWPVAGGDGEMWPVHCYGMVGVGRGLPPDTGNGTELYTVIGHAPRHLDRNIALVGRVIEGIENLSSLPRGTGPLGFYESAEERVPVVSIRLASELPAAQQPRFEYLSTESESFARYADARANRRDPFFIQPAGGADICNVPVPVRRVK